MSTLERTERVGVADVEIDDEFWSPWISRNRDVTIEYQYDQLQESGSLENFRRVGDGENGGFQGMWFQDSDAYKWLEAASYVLASDDDTELRSKVDEVVGLIEEAQADSGYLNTYFQLVEPDMKWTNLHLMHELYCLGHLIEAGVAHHEATGDDRLLAVVRKAADHVDDVFPAEVDGVPGHEEIELALIRLYHTTDEQRYLDLAEYFIEKRGRDDRLAWEFDHMDELGGAAFDSDSWEGSLLDAGKDLFLDDTGEYDGSYAQAHVPVVDQETVEGHSVRAMYLYAAVTDLVKETEDQDLREALEALWENMTTRRMYVTGGIGSEAAHEGFTEDYDLPNETAYTETCAAVGNIFWNQRLFELFGEAKYHDLVERTLYNGFLAGVGMNGTHFFYENPLASSGDHHRKGWFTCACCPPNAARLFASLGQYVYTKSDDGVYVNQYIGSSVETSVGEESVALEQTSSLPWAGKVNIDVTEAPNDGVSLHVRIPEWADNVTISKDGASIDHNGEKYVDVAVSAGDSVSVELEQQIQQLRAHPAVESDAGRVAVTRGPLVYCAESIDAENQLHRYAVSTETDIKASHQKDLLSGVTTLTVDSEVSTSDGWDSALYRPDEETSREAAKLELIPYYAWDNRDPGKMNVWLRAP
ncbi:glycoside hydrolase family 127 protein [Haloferax sp. DFSO52]|uniref:glycoside hydrolase family 127 protein n=1 Tax=Haloferax sp. DFSO52 TaxID=3388505 RepID=UPI003A83A1BF